MNSSFAKLSCVQVTGGGGFPAWIVVFSEEIQKNMDLIQSAREKLYAEVLNEFDAKGIDGMEPRYNGCGRLLQIVQGASVAGTVHYRGEKGRTVAVDTWENTSKRRSKMTAKQWEKEQFLSYVKLRVSPNDGDTIQKKGFIQVHVPTVYVDAVGRKDWCFLSFPGKSVKP